MVAKICSWNSPTENDRCLRGNGKHTSCWSRYDEYISWWRHQMEIFSASLAICAGNSPATGEFPAQRPVTRSFDAFFDLCLNKQLSKQSWGWWFETPSRPLRHHCNKDKLACPLHWQRNGNVISRKVSTTSGPSSDENLVKVTTFPHHRMLR